ncbi:MAG: mercury methylation corrinoid protein HgcA [Bacteroidales bacterium]|nr:mercury methylation corrinoid protein HgcA [Bacteroidales bacterium]
MKPHYITGQITTEAGTVAQVSTKLTNKDLFSTIKVRWSIGRMDYSVMPGLYAVGTPDENSDVYVSCNFKLSFDRLRRALHGIDAWILVLDTKGINVWCAAGKGTFGTKELAFRIKEHQLEKVVTHKKIIVPQLGATGVSAYKIKEEAGFKIIYGPVKANDIPAFVANDYKATPEMRKINFNLWERTKLVPVELFYAKYYLILVPAIFFILSGLNTQGFSVDASWDNGGRAIINLCVAYLSGCVLTPIFLPLIPFKSFSLKGVVIGWLMAILLLYFNLLGTNIFEIISWFLLIGGISSFMAMNFTGASTFTSLSGVQKEMKISLPIQIFGTALGFIGWIITRFI